MSSIFGDDGEHDKNDLDILDMSIVSSKGLYNQKGENNCFLNT